jgi:Na+/melibiose symporter-like transporter
LSAVRPAYWISGVLLVVAVVVPLLVPTYAKADPHLWGFPFFYWYQLLWVLISAVITALVYFKTKSRYTGRSQGGAQ